MRGRWVLIAVDCSDNAMRTVALCQTRLHLADCLRTEYLHRWEIMYIVTKDAQGYERICGCAMDIDGERKFWYLPDAMTTHPALMVADYAASKMLCD